MSRQPEEAQFVQDWSGRSPITYEAFLQAKQFERSIRYSVENQTKELIASNQELMERGFLR